MMDGIAKKRREGGVPGYANVYGPNELTPFRKRFHYKELLETWKRPFCMFCTEPIVLVLSLLSGFADALIFMQIQSFGLVYQQWGFGPIETGLAFISIGLGYVIAWLSFIPAINRNKRQRQAKPNCEKAQYESRLWWLLYTAPCLPVGLLVFSFTVHPSVHWIGSMIGAMIIGIANYAIYMATIDYMVAAYGPYAASATGGNGWARDILAGILTPAAVPFYSNILPPNNLRNASLILFGISVILVGFVFWVYFLRSHPCASEAPSPRARSRMLSGSKEAVAAAARQHRMTPPGTCSSQPKARRLCTWRNTTTTTPLGTGSFTPEQGSYACSICAQRRANSAPASLVASPVASRRNSGEHQRSVAGISGPDLRRALSVVAEGSNQV